MGSLCISAFVRGEAEGANHNDAAWLLDFYSTFAEDIDADASDHALSALSQVEGRFGVRTGLQLQLFDRTAIQVMLQGWTL